MHHYFAGKRMAGHAANWGFLAKSIVNLTTFRRPSTDDLSALIWCKWKHQRWELWRLRRIITSEKMKFTLGCKNWHSSTKSTWARQNHDKPRDSWTGARCLKEFSRGHDLQRSILPNEIALLIFSSSTSSQLRKQELRGLHKLEFMFLVMCAALLKSTFYLSPPLTARCSIPSPSSSSLAELLTLISSFVEERP